MQNEDTNYLFVFLVGCGASRNAIETRTEIFQTFSWRGTVCINRHANPPKVLALVNPENPREEFVSGLQVKIAVKQNNEKQWLGTVPEGPETRFSEIIWDADKLEAIGKVDCKKFAAENCEAVFFWQSSGCLVDGIHVWPDHKIPLTHCYLPSANSSPDNPYQFQKCEGKDCESLKAKFLAFMFSK